MKKYERKRKTKTKLGLFLNSEQCCQLTENNKFYCSAQNDENSFRFLRITICDVNSS